MIEIRWMIHKDEISYRKYDIITTFALIILLFIIKTINNGKKINILT